MSKISYIDMTRLFLRHSIIFSNIFGRLADFILSHTTHGEIALEEDSKKCPRLFWRSCPSHIVCHPIDALPLRRARRRGRTTTAPPSSVATTGTLKTWNRVQSMRRRRAAREVAFGFRVACREVRSVKHASQKFRPR